MSDGPAAVIVDSTGANIASVKPASTAAVATDPALVVAVSPNNTIPVSAASLPLPAGAATAANQTTLGSQTTKLNDGTNTAAVTAANALKVDGSAVTQPVSATSLPLPTGAATSANQTTVGSQTTKLNDGTNTAAVTAASALKVDGSAVTQPVSAASLPLPTGAATETTLGTRLADATFTGRINTLGQKTMANSTPVVLSSDQSVIPVSDNAGSLTVDSPQLPAALVGGRLDENIGAWLGSTAPTVGQKTMANSVPVVISSDQSEVQVKQGTAAALAGAWPVKQTDGTNIQPTGDAAARKIFVQPTDGTNNQGYDANNHAFVAGKSAVGVAPTGNPVNVGGVDDAGLKRALLTFTEGSLRTDPAAHRVIIHNNATIAASGSTVLTGLGMSEWYLVINLKNAPTGTTPTITFKIEILDPIDQTTVIDATKTVTGVVHTTASTESIQYVDNITDTVKISWTVTGTTPSWTGVNVSWVGHVAGNAVEGQAEDGQPLNEGPLPVAGVDSSNNVHTLKVDSQGRLSVVSASASASAAGFALGTVTTLATTDVPVRATTYTEQSSNAQRSVSSSNVNDTAAGTGARTVTITYYTSAGAGPFTETVTLNGTTAVATVSTTICYIEKIVVASVGSGGSNAGTISLFVNNAGGGGTIGTIAIGANQTLWAHHYVPTGKSCNITGLSGHNNNSSNGSIFSIRAQNLAANSALIVVSDYVRGGAGAPQATRSYGTPIQVAGPARVILYCAPEGTPSIVSRGSFDYYDQ